MSRKLLFLVISVIYLVLIAFGLTLVYSIDTSKPVKQTVSMAKDNKISIAHTEIFGRLQRPQVVFDHKKHEDAYRKEGCSVCHPVNDKKQVIFTFPKQVRGKGRKALMKAYHDECIDCHKKSAAESKPTGPVTCNNCHKKEFARLRMNYPVAEFDFYDHNKHVRVMKEKFGKSDCGQCHHTYDVKDKKISYSKGTEESCYYCHDLNKKRGPEFAAITKAAAEKGLSIERISHQSCLNCHLEYRTAYEQVPNEQVHGIHREKVACNLCHPANDFKHAASCTDCHIPLDCAKCHTGKYRTVEELKDVPRPDRGQKDMVSLDTRNARMKSVSFSHKAHQADSRTCRGCHHEGLRACASCHSLTGGPEGNGINVASAYHSVFAGQSCTGCHNKIKANKECAGCHYYVSAMNIETMNSKKDTCASCHAGKQMSMPKPLPYSGSVKEDVQIDVLAKEFGAASFPHRDVLNKLVRISNDSKLATYFHRDIQTLCKGCHHQSSSSAEVQMPQCRNCHMADNDRHHINKTRLISAYHRQCLGCHEKMEMTKGIKCSECHKKNTAPLEITQLKNQNVVRQNTSTILNAWHPK